MRLDDKRLVRTRRLAALGARSFFPKHSIPLRKFQAQSRASRAKRRILGSAPASSGIALTPCRFSLAKSLRMCSGGISRKRLQPSSWSTVVASCHQTACAMLFARSMRDGAAGAQRARVNVANVRDSRILHIHC